MEIINLPIGKAAAADVDCIRIEEQPDGRFNLTGTGLSSCGTDGEPESVGIVASQPYDSYEHAEAAGLAWANDLEIQLLYVSRSDGTTPLPDPGEN